jgi:LysM repeat protein
MKRIACALVLAGTASALTWAQHDAKAAPTRVSSGLQLSILTPDPTSIGDLLSLDVVCKGGVVDKIELYLDNNLMAQRQISTTQTKNIISFKLETLLLSAGDHDVVIKAYGTDGKSSSASSRVRIPALDLNSPVRISYPQNGTQVSGTVPVRLSLDQDTMKTKPYVTFFVDKEFKVLRNTPPYEYNWDTTKVANGWHIIEAWSQAGDALSPTKARPVRVTVNNGGGETKLQNNVEDLGAPKTGAKPITLTGEKPVAPKVDPATAHPAGSSVEPGVVNGKPGSVHLDTAKPHANTDGVRTSEPTAFGYGKTSALTGDLTNLSGPELKMQRHSPRASGGAAKQPSAMMAVASINPNHLPGLVDEQALIPIIQHVTGGGSTGTVSVKPGDTTASISNRTGVSQSEIERLNGLHTGSRLKGGSIIVPRAGSFDVAFDGTQIAFDVRPRTEAGVHLAPFRQIFEHSGGRLYWFGGTAQTVLAVNDKREIKVKIGDASATVNNQAVKMEKTPYIDSGRTIVPLSFIRDSMDVKISFDEKTGRLLIQSNK